MSEKDLLASLEAQGKEFLSSFADLGTKQEWTKDDESLPDFARSTTFDEELEEWAGFGYESDTNKDLTESAETRSEVGSNSVCTPEVVVFSGSSTSRTTKTQGRSFMSSKVARLKESSKEASDGPRSNEDVEKEISNAHNDALLHRLVHTQLLSGSLNPELGLTAAQRRKALAGRVLELAGDSQLGKGESNVRQEERKKASKGVRDGMVAKQKERDVKSLNEAKDVGNYHPALKRLFSASSSTQPRRRDRGLKMGVGRFSGGMLKLTPEEIGSVQNVRSARGRGSLGKRKR
ncbi:hypothetical protein JB92DRAFT_3113346 [Gautieria morchelliformis]|nr:hypothetical protein JB92DRAFT_3113346 [Gautieria morchelliformis]